MPCVAAFHVAIPLGMTPSHHPRGNGTSALDLSDTQTALAPFTVHLFCQGRSRKGKGKRNAAKPPPSRRDCGVQRLLSFLLLHRGQVSKFPPF